MIRASLLASVMFAALFTPLSLVADSPKARLGDNSSPRSLYSRLGGTDAIRAVVDDIVANAAADPRIKHYFAATAADPQRLRTFKETLVNQLCEGTGGPCKYEGKDMRTAHRGMNISGPHFDAFMEDVAKAFDENKIQGAEREELLAILKPMRGDIVERPV